MGNLDGRRMILGWGWMNRVGVRMKGPKVENGGQTPFFETPFFMQNPDVIRIRHMLEACRDAL
jgi:hypothetical protein